MSRGPKLLEIRLVPGSTARRLKQERTVAAMVWIPPGGFGAVAFVFSHRAAAIARIQEVDLGLLLGHLMAHEVGHLLLGNRNHSAGGIMHDPWTKTELDYLRQGALKFHPGDAEQIRKHLRPLAGPVAGLRQRSDPREGL